jgi:alkylation response protein AidB-like acyl-CoA dehydrogenase
VAAAFGSAAAVGVPGAAFASAGAVTAFGSTGAAAAFGSAEGAAPGAAAFASAGAPGAAWQALDKARQYLFERKAFGRNIGDFQAMQFKIADMATDLEAARLMIYRAADAMDRADPQSTMYSAMAKRMATDFGFKVCNEALQIHGGYGYIREYPLERWLRDVRVHQILEGTNEVMRLIVSRDMLGN